MREWAAGLGVGATLKTAMLSLCAGGLIRTWTDSGSRLWSVEDHTLQASMYEGLLARTLREKHRFREVALLDEEHGVLLLSPRIRSAGGTGQVELSASTIRLGPAGAPNEEVMADLADGLSRAIRYTASAGGFLLVEKGGWDPPDEPFCLFLVDDGVVQIETAPAPTGSKFWADHIRPGEPGATISAPASPNVIEVAWRIMLDAAQTWSVNPWDLALTYGVR